MRGTEATGALLLVLLVSVSGCGDSELLRARYQAERRYWEAARAEFTARLGGQRPDSVQLLALRESYRAVEGSVRLGELAAAQESSRKLRGEILHVIAISELRAGRLGLEANRLDLALQACERVESMAEEDSMLRREADYFRVTALRESQRYEEAIGAMGEILRRYQPALRSSSGAEDPILSIPEAIVDLRRSMGDRLGAERASVEAEDYYRRQLQREWSPTIRAGILARLVRLELDQEDWDKALRDLERLRTIAQVTPSLIAVEPEIHYYEAKIQSMKSGSGDPTAAVALLDAVAKEYPGSPFAAKATFDAGTLLEQRGRKKEAVERYKIVSSRYANDLDVAPTAAYRRALLEDALGNWERAKNLLDMIPLRYPDSQAAIDAPMTIVHRYRREGDQEAAELALRRAIATYQGLLARDSTSTYRGAHRWGLAQAQLELGEWNAALATIDEMYREDPGHPFTAQGLLRGATVAEGHGLRARAADYLEQFLLANPDSPLRDKAGADLDRLRKTPIP